MPRLGSPLWWNVISTIVAGVGIGVLAQPQLFARFMTVKSNKELNRAVLIGGIFILSMTGVAFVGGALSNSYFFRQLGEISVQVTGGNIDLIIPTFINMAMPPWFVYIFTLTLLAAAMSTISSQFHAMGTPFSRDVFGKNAYQTIEDETNNRSVLLLAKIAIVIGIIISVILRYYLPISIIARGTAVFFGVCAATFLPMYVFALYLKGPSRAGAVSGMVVGVISSIIWMMFNHDAIARDLGISRFFFGVDGVLPFPWSSVDPIFIAFPLAFLVTWIVSLFTKKLPQSVIEKSFAIEKKE